MPVRGVLALAALRADGPAFASPCALRSCALVPLMRIPACALAARIEARAGVARIKTRIRAISLVAVTIRVLLGSRQWPLHRDVSRLGQGCISRMLAPSRFVSSVSDS